VLCEVIGEPIKRLAWFIGEPIILKGKRALRKALMGALHRLVPHWAGRAAFNSHLFGVLGLM
jgi:hypothetical protein